MDGGGGKITIDQVLLEAIGIKEGEVITFGKRFAQELGIGETAQGIRVEGGALLQQAAEHTLLFVRRTSGSPPGSTAPPAGEKIPKGKAQKTTVSPRLTQSVVLFSPALRWHRFKDPLSVQTRVYQRLWFCISSQRCFSGRTTSTALMERGSPVQLTKREKTNTKLMRSSKGVCLFTSIEEK